MQAITVAIGKKGIDFFAHELVADELVRILSNLRPPDKTISLPDIHWSNDFWKATEIRIGLTGGSLQNFKPQFQGISQQAGGTFPLAITASNFAAAYKWHEHWHKYHWWVDPIGHIGMWEDQHMVDQDFPYAPAFSSLTINVPLQFKHENQSWSVVAGKSTGTPVSNAANIPGDSVVQYETAACFSSHVSDATAAAISSIDFASSLNKLLAGNIASIPDSGDLGGGMKYDFSLGDSGILFPNDNGIQMGVHGGASYNGTSFSGTPPPTLPLPPAPDTHHLNMYVSNYEVDALNWTFYKAGKLNVVVNPGDLQDPKILKVATYVSSEPSLKPYQPFSMQAHISPNAAPTTAFQSVWDFPDDVIAALRKKLPSTKVISDFLDGINGNVYVSKSSLEDYMTDAGVPTEYFKTIEETAEIKGMVVTSDLNFDLIIQGKENPDIKFSVTRTDVLSNLRLGVGANNTQTMQYGFINVTFSAKFISSTVPHFKGGDNFSNVLWQQAGEPEYEKALSDMGKAGTPLPIMADFKFDFTNAALSVQDGYVSILADVLYKNQ